MKKTTQKTPEKKGALYTFEHTVDKYRWPLAGAAAVLLLGLPFLGFTQYIMRIIIMVGVYAMLALGLNLLTGYTGPVSLGHAGFFGIGAYTCALLMLRLDVNFFVAMLAGAALSALCGLLLGMPTLRLSGSYLTIVTLGFGEIVKMIITNWDPVTNGTLGLKNIPRPELFGIQLTLANNGMYYLMLILVLVASLICYVIIHSRTGRALQAIREDELAATMMGIKTTRFKILAFVFSALLTGLAGAFYASLTGYIDQNSFTFDVSIIIISIVILGGMGTMRGMYLGAAVLITFPEVFRFLMDYRFVVYGLVLVLMMRFRPQGILGWKSQLPYRLPKQVKKELGSKST